MSENLNKKTCGECIHLESIEPMGLCKTTGKPLCLSKLPACSKYEQKTQTLFDRITASSEVLAESIVYEECEHSILTKDGIGATFPGGYTSPILEYSYRTKAEAIAATVEKLKEVYNG